jgi:hypothetical protein
MRHLREENPRPSISFGEEMRQQVGEGANSTHGMSYVHGNGKRGELCIEHVTFVWRNKITVGNSSNFDVNVVIKENRSITSQGIQS